MKKIISNVGLILESDFNPTIFSTDRSIYEVVRVIDGVGIFLEDHFVRLQKSFKTQDIVFNMTFKDFEQNVSELIILNQKTDGNFKFVFSILENRTHWAFYFIPHYYPTELDYVNGVSTDLLFAERENPNAKVIQNRIRKQADQLITDQNLYEILLVNREGMITEGSRSNVFFVRDEVFYTAPTSKVLVGITRLKVLECLNELGFQLIEKPVAVNEINCFDAAFLTGTSPKVLPVRFIGTQLYETQLQCVKMLMDLYDMRISQYISQNSLKG